MDLSGFEPEASSMPRRRSSELIYKPKQYNEFRGITYIQIKVTLKYIDTLRKDLETKKLIENLTLFC